MEILCFFAGVCFFYLKKTEPLCFLLVCFWFKPRIALLCWFAAGLLWSLGHQWVVADQGMPRVFVVKQALLDGHIASIPNHTGSKTQFQFVANALNHHPVHARIALSCYQHCPDVRVGERWRLIAKLQRPRNLMNPGGFDYVKQLAAQHVEWTGYLKPGSEQLQDPTLQRTPRLNRYFWLIIRQKMAAFSEKIGLNEQQLGILQALTLGLTTHLQPSDWSLFRRTGTTHLMVISGAHIGLMAGLSYRLIRWLWGCFAGLCLRYPAQKIASIGAFFMALVYAVMAGFGVPAQRALWVCFFMMLHRFCYQKIGVWQAWRYALFAVLLLEPHSVLLPGFYLSFLAVAVLMVVGQRYVFSGVRKNVIVQLACLVGLMPMTLFFFSYGAVNGLFANALAIPFVSFIIVPLGLFTVFFGHWLLWPAQRFILAHAVDGLMQYLHWIDQSSFMNATFFFPNVWSTLGLMVSITGFVCFPTARVLMVLLMMVIASFFPAYETVKPNTAQIDLLDVGQGLSVVIRTAKHTLVYDTGVQFYQGGDMGERVVVPYLRTTGVRAIDAIVVSHPDLDHRGGLVSIEAAYPNATLIVDNPSFYKRGQSCHERPDWIWDGVLFHFFPLKATLNSKNNASCVLRVSANGKSVLLTGDVERAAEDELVQRYGQQLASSVLIIPHHGSKTSSTVSFLEHVKPCIAMVSYGFDNRYHFPHAAVMQRYRQRAIPVYSTRRHGMVRVILNRSDRTLPAVSFYNK